MMARLMKMKFLLWALLSTAVMLRGDEPAIEALIADSPVIVVAEPSDDEGSWWSSQVVLAQSDVPFKIRKVLKADRELKTDEVITVHLVEFAAPPEDFLKLKTGKSYLLFLRAREKGIFEKTSLWFGLMPHTVTREMMIEAGIKEESVRKVKAGQSKAAAPPKSGADAAVIETMTRRLAAGSERSMQQMLLEAVSPRWEEEAREAEAKALARAKELGMRFQVPASELKAAGEKALAALREELASSDWTQVLVVNEYHCSCIPGTQCMGFRLSRMGGGVAVVPWYKFEWAAEPEMTEQAGEPRMLTPTELKRLLEETAVYFEKAVADVEAREKMLPWPGDEAMREEWMQNYVDAGGLVSEDGKRIALDTHAMRVRITTAQGTTEHSNLRTKTAQDFLNWTGAFGIMPGARQYHDSRNWHNKE